VGLRGGRHPGRHRTVTAAGRRLPAAPPVPRPGGARPDRLADADVGAAAADVADPSPPPHDARAEPGRRATQRYAEQTLKPDQP
jgi:hypothetical protein